MKNKPTDLLTDEEFARYRAYTRRASLRSRRRTDSSYTNEERLGFNAYVRAQLFLRKGGKAKDWSAERTRYDEKRAKAEKRRKWDSADFEKYLEALCSPCRLLLTAGSSKRCEVDSAYERPSQKTS